MAPQHHPRGLHIPLHGPLLLWGRSLRPSSIILGIVMLLDEEGAFITEDDLAVAAARKPRPETLPSYNPLYSLQWSEGLPLHILVGLQAEPGVEGVGQLFSGGGGGMPLLEDGAHGLTADPHSPGSLASGAASNPVGAGSTPPRRPPVLRELESGLLHVGAVSRAPSSPLSWAILEAAGLSEALHRPANCFSVDSEESGDLLVGHASLLDEVDECWSQLVSGDAGGPHLRLSLRLGRRLARHFQPDESACAGVVVWYSIALVDEVVDGTFSCVGVHRHLPHSEF